MELEELLVPKLSQEIEILELVEVHVLPLDLMVLHVLEEHLEAQLEVVVKGLP